MAIPKVEFPVPQERLQETRETLLSEIKGRQAEMDVMRAMLVALVTMCNHKKKCGHVCPDCGKDTTPDYGGR
jgi:hypothetical protein